MPIPRHLKAQRRVSARGVRELTLQEVRDELRAVLTGVQILFAFLLGLAFTGRFTQLDDFDVGVYMATLLLTVITTAIIATPITLHRRMGHSGSKPNIIPIAAHLAKIGQACLALTLNGAVLLVSDVALGRPAGLCVTLITVLIFTGLWFVLPQALRPTKIKRKSRAEHLPPASSDTQEPREQ
ncbi:DUF6328 family protein [Streptomyces sp. NPDC086549]|uniref:DUF6328 family protein n=1 Tax=Streptomyces sp. NPDC086549 TaxID=3365752 RepID=UPI0037F7CD2B